MARHETREIASYLRNGSLWVGHYVVGDFELNFGDDRMDAAHGLGSVVYAEPTSPTNEVNPQIQARNQSAVANGGGKTASVAKLDPVVEPLKRAA